MADNTATVLVTKIMVIVIAVLMIATVALPVIEDIQTEIKSTAQNTDMTYKAISPTDDGITLSISSGVVTFGTQVITLTAYTQILVAENFGISAGPTDSVFVITLEGDYAVPSSVTVNSTGITYGDDGDLSYGSFAFVMSNTGDYGIFSNGDVVNFNADTILYFAGDYSVENSGASPTSYTIAFGGSGKYNNMASSYVRNITDADVVGTATVSLNVTEKAGYYSCVVDNSAASISYTTGGTTYTIESGTPRVIAPIQYLYISDTDAGMASLIGVLPILLILVPVMMAVRMMALKRN